VPSFVCTVEGGNCRLDRYAAEHLALGSRSQLRARGLQALVDGKEAKVSRILKPGERLELFWEDPAPSLLVPEDLPLELLYEDERVAVVNKAPGMVVHPGAGNPRGTLANALLYRRLRRGLPCGESLRPGIVHRLDKDTSGVIITAWDEETTAFLSEQFRARTVR
jgi:23S rRNA pseudouridine1911/1915/1917 synthase